MEEAKEEAIATALPTLAAAATATAEEAGVFETLMFSKMDPALGCSKNWRGERQKQNFWSFTIREKSI